jgi:type VI secretion system protein ImpH
MAPASGTENPDVALENHEVALEKVHGLLFAEPYSFDFFQAVRLLGWMHPGKSPVGRYSHPHNEVVRFGANPILHFPASAIHALRERKDECPAMTINFMGLVGPLGALPNYVTELIATRIRAKDRTLLAFLDIFNHRLTSFFYQAWEKNHFTVAYERDRSDPITACLYAMVGFGTKGIRERQPVEDEAFIYYSGLFGLIPRSALALEDVLSDYFDIPVELEPFIGTWRSLADPDQCTFGGPVTESTVLGFGAVVGDEIWDRGSRVRLKLGPLSAARYRDFLPTGNAWPSLKAIVRSFSGYDLEFEIQLILRREDVPALELRPPAENALCLGWQTWLKSGSDFDRNPGDTILLLGEA